MTFSLEVVPAATVAQETFKVEFTSKCVYGDFEAEKEHVGIILDRAEENRARLHVLSDDAGGDVYGFIALHLHTLYGSPCVVVDFLFASSGFRGLAFDDLGGLKVSEYLLEHAIDTARKVSVVLPIKYVALQTIDDKLLPFYGRHGFEVLDESWMTLAIQ